MKFPKLVKTDFLYFLIVCFVFISSTALSLSKDILKEKEEELKMSEVKTKVFTDIPRLQEGNPSFPVVSAQAALAIDLDSMTPLYEKNPDLSLLPASTTKIITALVALDYYKESDVLTVDGIKVDGQRIGLSEGEKLTAGSLLDALLIFSANDAAETLAQNYPGGYDAFIWAMNQKAVSLNLTNSHFENPVGYDGLNQYSTAKDLTRAAILAMQNPRFSQRVKQKEKIITNIDGTIKYKLVSTNELLGSVDGILGVKTGWTENARENLITYMERDKRRIMIAIMGSQDRFGETKELINWIYGNYKWTAVTYPSE